MYSAITSYAKSFLLSYGYESFAEFAMSLCPSFKYNLQTPTMAVSSMFAIIAYYLGVSPLIAVAMLIAVVVETISGIGASRKLRKPFESFRFSRCVLKVFIWITLVFIANAFSLECSLMHNEWWSVIGVVFFDVVKLLILTYFVLEYVVSILENLAVLEGKPKTEFIDVVKSVWTTFAKNLRRNYASHERANS